MYSINSYVKIGSPLWLHPIPGDHDLTNDNLPYLRMLPQKSLLFVADRFLRRFLKILLNIFLCKIGLTHCTPILSPESWFEQTWIWGCKWFWTRKFKKKFNIFLCKNLTPHFGPNLTPGIMIWTNLNLHYMRMFPQKFQIFVADQFLKRRFYPMYS